MYINVLPHGKRASGSALDLSGLIARYVGDGDLTVSGTDVTEVNNSVTAGADATDLVNDYQFSERAPQLVSGGMPNGQDYIMTAANFADNITSGLYTRSTSNFTYPLTIYMVSNTFELSADCDVWGFNNGTIADNTTAKPIVVGNTETGILNRIYATLNPPTLPAITSSNTSPVFSAQYNTWYASASIVTNTSQYAFYKDYKNGGTVASMPSLSSMNIHILCKWGRGTAYYSAVAMADLIICNAEHSDATVQANLSALESIYGI